MKPTAWTRKPRVWTPERPWVFIFERTLPAWMKKWDAVQFIDPQACVGVNQAGFLPFPFSPSVVLLGMAPLPGEAPIPEAAQADIGSNVSLSATTKIAGRIAHGRYGPDLVGYVGGDFQHVARGSTITPSVEWPKPSTTIRSGMPPTLEEHRALDAIGMDMAWHLFPFDPTEEDYAPDLRPSAGHGWPVRPVLAMNEEHQLELRAESDLGNPMEVRVTLALYGAQVKLP